MAALAGIAFPTPGRALVDGHGLDAVLAVLVFASALTVPDGWWSEMRSVSSRVGLALVASTVMLPLVAFALSRLVAATDVRHALLAVGVAPAEVASLAVSAIAGARVAVAAALLMASTVLCVVVAGPVLSVLAGGGVAPAGVLGTLALVVAVPLALGLSCRSAAARRAGWTDGAAVVAVVAVVVLVWLVSSQVHLDRSYLGAGLLLVLFIGASAVLGGVLARGLAVPVARAVVLPVSMRDFAIASGIATAAFGPAAAGPLALYGVLVMTWGAAATRYWRLSGR